MTPDRPVRRPLVLGDLLAQTLRLVRRHGRVLVGLYALVDLPLFVVTSIVSQTLYADLERVAGPGGLQQADGFTPEEVATLIPGLLQVAGLTLLQAVLAVVSAGAIAIAVSRAVDGQQPRFSSALGGALRRAPALLGASVLSLLAVIALVAVAVVPLAGAGVFAGGPVVAPGGGLPTFLGLVLIVAVTVAIVGLSVRWTFSFAAPVLDGQGPIGALRMSWRITRGYAWRVFGISLLVAFATFIIASLINELGGLLGSAIASTDTALGSAIVIVVGALGSSLVGVLVPVAMTLLYLDLRSRAATRS